MTKSKNSFLEILLFLSVCAFACVLAFGGDFSYAVLSGINLWALVLLPSLFPYFFITAILSSMRITSKLCSRLSPLTTRLFNVNGAVGYAFFMSVISGYPVGAKCVCDLKNNNMLSDEESTRAAALCSTASPMFMIVSVGAIMFSSRAFGTALFLTHLLSCFSTGIIFSFYKRKSIPLTITPPMGSEKIDNLLYESVYSAVISVLVVGGLITLFYLVCEILLSFNILTPVIDAINLLIGDKNLSCGIVLGALECTRGLKSISASGITNLTLPVCSAICGFGGLSVIIQSLAYLKKAKIKTAPFLLSKLLSAVVNFIFGFIVQAILL